MSDSGLLCSALSLFSADVQPTSNIDSTESQEPKHPESASEGGEIDSFQLIIIIITNIYLDPLKFAYQSK